MSADNFYVLRRHPKGGFALVMGFASTESLDVYVRDHHTQFASIREALRAFSEGQDLVNDEEMYPEYYCEYGLRVHPELFTSTQELTARLHSTTDAMVWATEFCKLFLVLTREGCVLGDEGTMVGWFANAIEIGRSAGQEVTSIPQTGYVYYRCQKCGTMTPPKQLEPSDDLGPHDYDCACWKGPVWQRGVWRPEERIQPESFLVQDQTGKQYEIQDHLRGE